MGARALLGVCFAAFALAAGSAASAGHVAFGNPPLVPPINWGVADDGAKYADDGGAWFDGMLEGANLTEDRWTLAWDPANPTDIDELPFLERAAPIAEAAGIHVVLSLYSKVASQHDPTAFCAWAATVAETVQQWGIHDYIVWNEPNTRLYWVPQQNAAGADVAAPAYEHLLATCYDTIHAADPFARVIGMGLSPRASTTASTEPLVFLRDVGAAYRASGRKRPIMDQLSIHPYPNPSEPTDGPGVGYKDVDRFGIPNLARVKQAVWDAFNGTAQPTTLTGLTFRIDEVGWQTDTTALPQYTNTENVAVVSEQTQADDIGLLATKYFGCDPTVTDVELFLLVDETSRNGKDATGKSVTGGWQSGLLTAGGEGVSEPKIAYTQDAPLFAEGRDACAGRLTTWAPIGSDPASPTSQVGLSDGVLATEARTAFATLLGGVSTLQSNRRPFQAPGAAKLALYYQPVVSALLRTAGPPSTAVTAWAGVVGCGAVRGCTAAGALASAWQKAAKHKPGAPSYVLVAGGSQRSVAGSTLEVTLAPPTTPVVPPQGAYYLVITLRSKEHPLLEYGVSALVRPAGPALP
jgi:hypothetical protein